MLTLLSVFTLVYIVSLGIQIAVELVLVKAACSAAAAGDEQQWQLSHRDTIIRCCTITPGAF